MTELTMTELFASGRIVDAILVLVAVEAVALLLWRRRTGRGPAPVPLLCNLASGAALMLAVRAALTDAAWPVIAACLLGSLVAHACELGLRLRGSPEPGMQPVLEPQMREDGTGAKIVTFPVRRQG